MLPGNMVFTVISWRRSGIRKPPPEATRPAKGLNRMSAKRWFGYGKRRSKATKTPSTRWDGYRQKDESWNAIAKRPRSGFSEPPTRGTRKPRPESKIPAFSQKRRVAEKLSPLAPPAKRRGITDPMAATLYRGDVRSLTLVGSIINQNTKETTAFHLPLGRVRHHLAKSPSSGRQQNGGELAEVACLIRGSFL